MAARKVHTVQSLGAELLALFPALEQPRYGQTLARTLLSALCADVSGDVVAAADRTRVLAKAKRLYL